MEVNAYSRTWFDTFLADFSPAQTEVEAEFIARHLPLPAYRSVLDLCCGMGRHAVPLAERGYEVTGVDLSTEALAAARESAPQSVTLLQGDMRDLSFLRGEFDAVLSLWQSFGYFGEDTNASILRQISDKLRRDGRFILDIYHRGFFEAHQGERRFERNGLTIVESKRMVGNRLTVTLNYGPAVPPDVFDWQLYTPEEIEALAAEVGFRLVASCTGFEEHQPATSTSPRMQLVFEKK